MALEEHLINILVTVFRLNQCPFFGKHNMEACCHLLDGADCVGFMFRFVLELCRLYIILTKRTAVHSMDSSTTTIEISFWTHILNDNWMHICLKKNLVHSFPTPKNYDMLNTKSSEHQTLIRCFRQASRHHKRTNRMPLDLNLGGQQLCLYIYMCIYTVSCVYMMYVYII